MTRKKTILAALGAAAVLGASAVYAQDQPEQPPQAEAPAMQPETMPGGMMRDQQGMMPMMGMMAEMQDMMRTCNEMMKAMMPDESRPAPQDRPDGG